MTDIQGNKQQCLTNNKFYKQYHYIMPLNYIRAASNIMIKALSLKAPIVLLVTS